jgi:hypothetical protein
MAPGVRLEPLFDAVKSPGQFMDVYDLARAGGGEHGGPLAGRLFAIYLQHFHAKEIGFDLQPDLASGPSPRGKDAVGFFVETKILDQIPQG